MTKRATAEEPTYSLGAVCRLTGLSAHVLRAWERRYAAVEPLRTAGGTRRYQESDVARLDLLRRAVEAGHSIGSIAKLDDAELRRRVSAPEGASALPLAALVQAVERLDGEEIERMLGLQLAALGARRFATEVAAPLLREIGDAWEAGRLEIAAEHLASAVVRNLLGSALHRRTASAHAPPVVFGTPAGERHELGTLIGAVIAAEAGGNVTFLGSDLPLEELARSAERIGARAVAVGVANIEGRDCAAQLRELRDLLPEDCELWVGGTGIRHEDLPEGVDHVPDLEVLERKLGLLAL